MTLIESRARLAGRLAVALALTLGAGPLAAGSGSWSIRIEPVFVEVHGHEQHVLTVQDVDFDALPISGRATAVNLETNSDLAYRGEVRWDRPGRWSWGLDYFILLTSQDVPRQSAAGGPGPFDLVAFEIADRGFVSGSPEDVLFYDVLEDTDLQTWTVDLYGRRKLAGGDDTGIYLVLGLRTADFDNDYRAVVGVEGLAGTRVDASSNYDRMHGPLVALAGEARAGKHHFEGYLGQSVVLGSVELTNRMRDFVGPPGETAAFVTDVVFHQIEDVAIPITELRLRWTYEFTRRLSAGLGVMTSAWWDVPVPPGVIPGPGNSQALHENTIVYLGLAASVKLTF